VRRPSPPRSPGEPGEEDEVGPDSPPLILAGKVCLSPSPSPSLSVGSTRAAILRQQHTIAARARRQLAEQVAAEEAAAAVKLATTRRKSAQARRYSDMLFQRSTRASVRERIPCEGAISIFRHAITLQMRHHPIDTISQLLLRDAPTVAVHGGRWVMPVADFQQSLRWWVRTAATSGQPLQGVNGVVVDSLAEGLAASFHGSPPAVDLIECTRELHGELDAATIARLQRRCKESAGVLTGPPHRWGSAEPDDEPPSLPAAAEAEPPPNSSSGGTAEGTADVEHLWVPCPVGTHGGDTIVVQHGSLMIEVEVPAGVRAGEEFEIALSTAPPPAAAAAAAAATEATGSHEPPKSTTGT
jgi:hypothetical protein